MDLSFDTIGVEPVIAAATALGVEGGPIVGPTLILLRTYIIMAIKVL